MILSACSFSFMQIAVKLSGGEIPIMEQVFVRNFFTLFIGCMMALREGACPFGKWKNQPALLARGILGYLGVVMYFFASRNMMAADATLLHRSSPFFVAAFSCLFLRERFTKIHGLSFAVAAAGALCVIRPQFHSAVFPAVVGLLSAVCAGGAYTIISYLKGKENNGTIIFYFSLVSCVITLPFMLMDFVLPDVFGLVMLLLIGVGASAGQIFLTFAYKNAPAGEVSIYNFSGIICSSVLGFVILGETPDVLSFIGIGAIIAAAVLMFVTNQKTK